MNVLYAEAAATFEELTLDGRDGVADTCPNLPVATGIRANSAPPPHTGRFVRVCVG